MYFANELFQWLSIIFIGFWLENVVREVNERISHQRDRLNDKIDRRLEDRLAVDSFACDDPVRR